MQVSPSTDIRNRQVAILMISAPSEFIPTLTQLSKKSGNFPTDTLEEEFHKCTHNNDQIWNHWLEDGSNKEYNSVKLVPEISSDHTEAVSGNPKPSLAHLKKMLIILRRAFQDPNNVYERFIFCQSKFKHKLTETCKIFLSVLLTHQHRF